MPEQNPLGDPRLTPILAIMVLMLMMALDVCLIAKKIGPEPAQAEESTPGTVRVSDPAVIAQIRACHERGRLFGSEVKNGTIVAIHCHGGLE